MKNRQGEFVKSQERGAGMQGPLDGIRVVDLTSHLAGPYCTMLLADMGADVIKVERPGLGDETRKSPPFAGGESAAFMIVNRNKRSVVLDLKTDEGRADCMHLIDRADVLVENYRPGVADRLGLGWEKLHTAHPRLVYCSISGFGQTGPFSDKGGFDLMAQAMSGLMTVCGQADGGPLRLPIPISDLCGGMNGAFGVVSALYAREQTGRGQRVDTSLYEAALAMGPYEAAEYFTLNRVPHRLGQAHRLVAPYQIFPTSDGWVAIGAATQVFWERLCGLMGVPELCADPRFDTGAKRVENYDALVSIISEHVARETADEWIRRLEAAGIPVAPVLNHERALTHPQTLAREMVVEVEHPTAGRVKVLGVPVKFSDTPAKVRTPAPLLGQHTDEVLGELHAARISRIGEKSE
jgi:crotonobetainyl-CoA:carnitine CoA-transferase CaiB-like acyl-CoA transferase